MKHVEPMRTVLRVALQRFTQLCDLPAGSFTASQLLTVTTLVLVRSIHETVC